MGNIIEVVKSTKIFPFGNKKSYPLNKILIFKENLISNYNYLSSLNPNIQVAPVLKSNGYGYGIPEAGRIADKLIAPFLCVDSLYEAYLLQKAGVKTPILIMGFIDPRSLSKKRLPFYFTVFNEEMLAALNRYQKGAKVHLFVDTGMNREGFKISELKSLLEKLSNFPNIYIEGLMSHFAQANGPKDESALKQLENFKEAIDILNSAGIFPKYVHIGASSAALHLKSLHSNIVRTGLAFYGYDPLGKNTHLKSGLRLVTRIAQIKKVKKGEKIGYDGTYVAEKDLTVGILPIGYNDGVDRRLSNIGFVKVKENFCPIIGLISMNITTVDLSITDDPKIGDEVVVFSENREDKNSIQNCAQLCKTIPYELLVHLHSSTRREVV